MRRIYILFLLAASFVQAQAANEYPVADIPEALLKGANMVKRFEDIRFEIVNTGETVLKKKYAITVLNENGDDYAVFEESFDKHSSIRSVDGKLLDASGRELRSVKNKDIFERSAIASGNIYDDNKVKLHSFNHHVYPYTVVYEVTLRYDNSFYFPPWVPQETKNLSVQESRFTLVHPKSYGVRTKVFNYPGQPEKKEDDGILVSSWVVKNKPVITIPYAAPAWYEVRTVVFLGPTEFTFSGYNGRMDTWKDMGLFQITLNQGRDVLPDGVKQEVAAICAGVTSQEEKIKKLYGYLQQNTRYISVQLGIGGWQPFDAAYVARNKYGDCKALTNFMYSLLKEAGIPALYAIIRSGETIFDKSLIEDFPFLQFNHVVLCVPQQKDSIWLECTSQSNPAGYMGGFTGNRKALLVTPQGGVLASTPRYGIAENLQIRNLKGTLDGTGNLVVAVQTRYTGLQQDDLEAMIENSTKKEVKDRLNERLDLPSYEVVKFEYAQKKQRLPEITEKLELDVPRYASVSGKRIFVTPNLLSQSTVKMELDTARTLDYVFDYEYRDLDSLELEIPEGYQPESVPKPVTLKTKYGQYSYTVKVADNKIFLQRIMEHPGGRFAAKEGQELVNFWNMVYKTDRAKVVLVKKE